MSAVRSEGRHCPAVLCSRGAWLVQVTEANFAELNLKAFSCCENFEVTQILHEVH